MREVTFLRKSEDACTHYRVNLPAKHLQSNGAKVNLVNSVNEINLSDVRDKIFIFGRSCTYDELNVFREIRKRGGIAVYEIDDDLLELPSWNPASVFFLKVQVVVRNFLREANHIIVTTKGLKENFRQFNSNISIVDNYIDFDYLDEAVSPKIMNKESKPIPLQVLEGKFLLLWGGSVTHKVDLKLLERPLIAFFKKYPETGLVAIHTLNRTIFNALNINQLYLVHAVPSKQYLSLLQKLPANVGLAPLINHPFNLCKSRLKVIEYMTVGKVPLSSRVGPFVKTLGGTMYENFLCSDVEWFNKFEEAYNLWEFNIIRDSISSYAYRNFDIKNSNWIPVLSSL